MSPINTVEVLLGVSLGVFVACHFVYARCLHRHSSLSYPPGPKPLPLLGNFHQLRDACLEKTMNRWWHEFGDIVYVSFFHTPILVVNSVDVARDLMIKRSVKYSDRPRFVHMEEMMGWMSHLGRIASNDLFRKHRIWLHDAFLDKVSLTQYHPAQQKEVYILLTSFIESPDMFQAHHDSKAVLMEAIYGHNVTSTEDEFVLSAAEAMKEVAHCGYPGLTLLDVLPFLKYTPVWMPWGRLKKEATDANLLIKKMHDDPFNFVRNRMTLGTAAPSLTRLMLEKASNNGHITEEDEEDIKVTAGLVYGAGTDTTAITLSAFVLAMLLYPDVYKKAQDEIDTVIGPDRLPDFADRGMLPYLECILKEIYRWHIVVPLGVPHKLSSDDEYDNYDIPNGSIIVPNLWVMSHDSKTYPNPDAFCPERYIDKTGAHDVQDPHKFVFGFGRRTCPGRQFADASIWLAIANIIAVLDIRKARDSAGNEITPQPGFSSGFISHPGEYVCDIKPRSKKAESLVLQMKTLSAEM